MRQRIASAVLGIAVSEIAKTSDSMIPARTRSIHASVFALDIINVSSIIRSVELFFAIPK
jgi:hypothetical protein